LIEALSLVSAYRLADKAVEIREEGFRAFIERHPKEDQGQIESVVSIEGTVGKAVAAAAGRVRYLPFIGWAAMLVASIQAHRSHNKEALNRAQETGEPQALLMTRQESSVFNALRAAGVSEKDAKELLKIIAGMMKEWTDDIYSTVQLLAESGVVKNDNIKDIIKLFRALIEKAGERTRGAQNSSRFMSTFFSDHSYDNRHNIYYALHNLVKAVKSEGRCPRTGCKPSYYNCE